MTIERRALSGTVVGAIGFLVGAAQTLLLVPVLLSSWGRERYGAWLALQSLLSLVITLDAGHQNYVGTEIAKLYVSDRKALRVVLASAIWTATASGVVELLVVITLSLTRWLPMALGLGADTVHREQVGVTLVLLCLSAVLLNSICGMMARLQPPAGKFVRFSVWGIVFRSLQAIAVAAAALLGFGFIGAAITCAVASAAIIFLLFGDLRAQFPELWPMHRGGRASLGARHYAESLVLTGSGTLVQLQQSGLNLMVTRGLGAAALPAFTTARTLSGMFFLAPSILCNPLSPDMTRFHVNREHEKLHATFAANWLVGGVAIQFGTIVSLPFLASLYEAWTRHSMPFDRPLFALLAFSVVLRTFGAPLQTYLVAINQLRAITAMNVAETVTVLAVALLTFHRFGIASAGIAVAVGEVVASWAVPMLFVAAELTASWRARLWRDALLASGPILVTGLVLFAYATGVSLAVTCAGGTLLLLPLCVIQWLRLPTEVRVRIQGLLRSLANRAWKMA